MEEVYIPEEEGALRSYFLKYHFLVFDLNS